MRAITFSVPDLPPSSNVLERRHWSFRKRKRDEWMKLLWSAMGVNKLRQLRAWADLHQRVLVEIKIFHKRAYDPGNLQASASKIPLDALKGLNCIVNDSAKWIDLSVREVVGPLVRTEIAITNLAAGQCRPNAPQRRLMQRTQRP